jgi:nucleoid DNA-binding protein
LIESDFEKSIKILINDIVKSTELQIEKDDVEKIVQKILPNLDELVSKKVKQHFVEIGEFLVKKFDPTL